MLHDTADGPPQPPAWELVPPGDVTTYDSSWPAAASWSIPWHLGTLAIVDLSPLDPTCVERI